jgi:excisionase family DNA binding protein
MKILARLAQCASVDLSVYIPPLIGGYKAVSSTEGSQASTASTVNAREEKHTGVGVFTTTNNGNGILTVDEVARELRCSKAHVYKAIAGKVRGITALPAICMGRRKLVQRSSFEVWKKRNEAGAVDGIVQGSPEVDAARCMKGNAHA